MARVSILVGTALIGAPITVKFGIETKGKSAGNPLNTSSEIPQNPSSLAQALHE